MNFCHQHGVLQPPTKASRQLLPNVPDASLNKKLKLRPYILLDSHRHRVKHFPSEISNFICGSSRTFPVSAVRTRCRRCNASTRATADVTSRHIKLGTCLLSHRHGQSPFSSKAVWKPSIAPFQHFLLKRPGEVEKSTFPPKDERLTSVFCQTSRIAPSFCIALGDKRCRDGRGAPCPPAGSKEQTSL